MARYVTFNGITQFRPGGLTKVDANALAQIGLATNGIVGLIGEADGGEPNTIVTIDDPALAKESYRSGPLADAIRTAFDSSNDPRVPGGAFRCLCVKVNQGTQASLILYSRLWVDTVASATTTIITPTTHTSMTADELIGGILRIGSEERVITDNDATTITVGTAFSSIPAATTPIEVLVPVVTITSRDYGLHTNQVQFEYEPGASFGQAWTTYFEKSQVGDDIGGKAWLQLEYVGQATRYVQVSGTAAGTSTVTTIDETGAFTGLTLSNLFVEITIGGVANLRKISSHTDDQLVVATMSGAPTSGETYEVRSGQVRNGTLAVDAPASNQLTLEAGLDIAANELVGMVVVILTGTGAGQRRTIASHTTGTTCVLTLDEDWQTNPENGDTYELRYVTQAVASITGESGVAKSLVCEVAKDGGSLATDKTFTFTTGQTLEDLVSEINAEADYVATVPSGINAQTFLVKNFDFDLGAYQVPIGNDRDAVSAPTEADPVSVWANSFRADLYVMITDINGKNEFVTATRSTAAATGAGQGRPEFTGGVIGTVGDTFKYLSGGTRGTSTNTNWQAAFDLLIQQRANFVIPLIAEDLANQGYGSTATWASVAAQLSAHLSDANGVEKTERGGVIGYKGTKANLITQANRLNDTDIQIVSQRPTVLDVDGNLVEQDEWAMAVLAVGMRAGMPEVGEPLTHKFIKTSDLTQDTSWDPLDRTDANQLIQAGILFAENIKGKGIRWVRDITTHVQDDNLAYMEGSVRDVVRFVSYGLRTILEDRFTGVKASPANAEGLKDTAAEYLEAARSQNIIVDSTDANGGVVKAYHNLRVSISGDIATIRVEIFPVVGINFQLNEIFLQLPTQAA